MARKSKRRGKQGSSIKNAHVTITLLLLTHQAQPQTQHGSRGPGQAKGAATRTRSQQRREHKQDQPPLQPTFQLHLLDPPQSFALATTSKHDAVTGREGLQA